jgi:TATA-box binding protein (TBP) (component of TFIID and TFIIIB)
MNIFRENEAERQAYLEDLKSMDCMFSPMRNSTITAKGKLSNIEFDESELTDLEGEGKIIKIDSNFVEWKSPTYKPPAPKKKSNRGRKKKEKKKTNRKTQGTGRCMNSQIMFTILGTHVRRIPDTPDKHSEIAIPVDDEYEEITKPYVFLVFRNGNFTLPGVLTEDMSDVQEPIQVLCKYMSEMFEDVRLESIETSMQNYKFCMVDRQIELRKLQKYCSDHFTHLLNIHFRHVKQYLIEHINPDEQEIDYGEFHKFLSDAEPPKNLYVNFEKLREAIEAYNLMNHYRKITETVELIYTYYQIDFSAETITQIWSQYLDQFLVKLEKKFKASSDNQMSHIRYDQEKYPGFIIKIKTPRPSDPQKKTTIKLFMSGKIDIDGANNREEAEYIYWWLNSLFTKNRYLSYNPDDPSEESDDEYSWTDSEDLD